MKDEVYGSSSMGSELIMNMRLPTIGWHGGKCADLHSITTTGSGHRKTKMNYGCHYCETCGEAGGRNSMTRL
eukprot:766006-Hanusia_phi.AAC.5